MVKFCKRYESLLNVEKRGKALGRGIKRIAPEGKKWCPVHKDFLPIESFRSDKSRKDGLYALCAECSRKSIRERYARNPKEMIVRQFKYNYGMTPEEYEQLYQEQCGVCAVCKQPETFIMRGKVMALSVDHCHKSNRVRALLCRSCNLALGFMEDDPERIKSLLAYAKKWYDKET